SPPEGGRRHLYKKAIRGHRLGTSDTLTTQLKLEHIHTKQERIIFYYRRTQMHADNPDFKYTELTEAVIRICVNPCNLRPK
ncbi:hypothetical protein C5S36_14170, partial [Candidatus Methanophagaceae archaeon]